MPLFSPIFPPGRARRRQAFGEAAVLLVGVVAMALLWRHDTIVHAFLRGLGY